MKWIRRRIARRAKISFLMREWGWSRKQAAHAVDDWGW